MKIAVVGASLAGLNAAEALLDCPDVTEVALIDAEDRPPCDRPPLSEELPLGTWQPSQCALPVPHDPRLTRRGGTRVTGLDTKTLTLTFADHSTETFDGGIVIATGTVPRALPGLRLPGVHVLRTMDDALKLRKDLNNQPNVRVLIAGGGFTGTEVAAACAQYGHRVTIAEAREAPFAQFGPEVGAALVAPLLASVSGTNRVKGVMLEDGTLIPAEVVVLGLGVEPATDWLAGSGLELDGGVHVDSTLRAGRRIVAAGDVARWPNRRFGEFRRVEHWDNAIRQGRHAGQRLLAEHGHGTLRDHQFVALYRRGDQLTAALGLNHGKLITKYRRLLSQPVRWATAVAALEAPATR